MSATLAPVKDPVTTKAAAAMLDVSRSAVLKAIKKRRLPAEPFGRDYQIEREEVERYRQERKLTGPRKRRPIPFAYPMAGDIATGKRIADRPPSPNPAPGEAEAP